MGLAGEGWPSGKTAQLGLRGAGLVLLAGACLGGRWLAARFAQEAGVGGGDSLGVAVAFVVFAAASAGLMLTTLGPALLRRYAVPARYCRHGWPPKTSRIGANAGLSGGFFG